MSRPVKDDKLTEKDLERVLLHICALAGDSGKIYRPVGFYESMEKYTSSAFKKAFAALYSKGLIDYNVADLPDSDNINNIVIMSGASAYLVEREDVRKNYWKNWRWNIVAAIVTTIISSLIGAVLARLSLMLCP